MSNLKKIEYQEAFNDASAYLKKGGEPGLKLGFSCLDEYYTHKNSGVTDWTGFPGSGKTYFALECLMNLSERYEKRHGLFVPDIGSDKEIIAKLVKMRTGKDYHDKYNNKISDKELAEALNWILHYFVIFKKADFKTGVTPIDFWELVCSYKDDGGIIHTGLIDSWKNMKHIYSGREDLYLDEALSVRNELAERNNKHFHTIAHAIKTDQDQAGKRRVPTAWDIKGGGSWNANGKNIITVDFPDKTHNRVDLYISKVKPEDVGKVGAIIERLFLDYKKGRYYEKLAPYDYYAFEHEKGFKIMASEELF
ncbi:MAG: hypothetical protein JWR05_3513 [Mucilaginibacter sp.]|nr:hypothetical protein [Mucilaginibacter sp.]